MTDKEKKDIAIVGISARLPSSLDLDDFWSKLCQGKNFIRKIPPNRQNDIRQFYRNQEEIYYYDAAYLDEIDKFDYQFFKITPREAALIDPNQRILLEVLYSCIEDSGNSPRTIEKTNTGIFIGFADDFFIRYLDLLRLNSVFKENASTLLNASPFIAGRLAHFLNITGPNMVINTACSSSLSALHVACKSIQARECEQALVASSNISYQKVKKEKLPIESLDSKLRSFDKKANGTIWGEGAIALLIKPLDQALVDKDNIYGVVRGSAINHDGRSTDLTTPNRKSQTKMLIKAWGDAKINPQDICYIEAHGTSTTIGDLVELEAIDTAVKKFTNKKHFFGLGTVKANIGHLDCASGLAGVLKVLLAIKNKQLPPQINIETPNKGVNKNSAFYLNTKLKNLPSGNKAKIFGVNSFGLSGTNCHVVIAEPSKQNKVNNKSEISIFTLSAKTKESLEKYVEKYIDYLEKNTTIDISSLCFTANTGREQFQFRLAIIIEKENDLINKLKIINSNGLVNIKEKNIYYGEKIKNIYITDKELDGILKNYSKKSDQKINKILCQYFCQGSDINWNKIYKSNLYKKISLPTYPFEKNRCWPEIKKETLQKNNVIKKSEGIVFDIIDKHPDKIICSANLNQTDWAIKDHIIDKKYTLVGAAYLEIAVRAFQILYPDSGYLLENIFLYRPLIFLENEKKTIKITINKTDNVYKFKIENGSFNDRFILYAQGDISACQKEVKKINLKTIIKKSKLKKINFFYDEPQKYSDYYGERWNNITRHYKMANKYLNHLEVPDKFSHETNKYYLYPALVDNFSRFSFDNEQFVPYSYRSIKINSNVPSNVYAYVTPKSDLIKNHDYRDYDIDIINQKGEIIMQMRDFRLIKIDYANNVANNFEDEYTQERNENYYCKMNWNNNKSLYNGKKENNKTPGVLILRHENDFNLSAGLKNYIDPKKYIEIILSDNYKKISNSIYRINCQSKIDFGKALGSVSKINQIFFLGGLEIAETKNIDLNYLKKINKYGFFALAYLFQSLDKCKLIKNNLSIKIITNNIHEIPLLGGKQYLYPFSSALLGLAKVLVKEYSDINLYCLDLDKKELHSKSEFSKIVRQIINPIKTDFNGEDFAIRKNKILNREIIPIKFNKKGKTILKKKGVYWLIGGANGLGFEVAKNLANKYSANLILTGRRELNDDIKEKINIIKNKSGRAYYLPGDISNYNQLENVFKNIIKKFGKLDGIINSAVSYKPALIKDLSINEMEEISKTKIEGSYNLFHLMKNYKLDFMVFFSSIYSYIGDRGLAVYSSENSFINNYVKYYSKLKNFPIFLFNWGLWGETGLATKIVKSKKNVFKYQGVKTISNLEGLIAFEKILRSDNKEAIIFKATENYIKKIFRSNIFTKKLFKKDFNHQNHQKLDQNINIAKINYELKLVWKEVLGYENIKDNDNFFVIGGDSISAMQLISAIEQKLRVSLKIKDIFKNPTIKSQSRLLLKK